MKNIRLLKVIVVGLLVGVLVFTVAMIYLFYLFQCVPDSLIYSFYGFCGGEAYFTTILKKAEGVIENAVTDVTEAIETKEESSI